MSTIEELEVQVGALSAQWADVADRLSSLVGRRDLLLQQEQNWAAGTAVGGPYADGSYPIDDSTGFTRLIPSPAKIAALAENTSSGAGGLGITAEQAGFVKGAGTANASINRSAWLALLAGTSKYVYFGEGDWDLRFAGISALLNCDLVLIGAGPNSRLLVNGSSIYLNIGSGNLETRGLHWWSASDLTSGQIFGLDSMTANTDRLIIENNWFTNVYIPIRTTNFSALSSVNAYLIDEYRVNRNVVHCKQGLARVATKRGGRVVEYQGNLIDCGKDGGGDPGFGCIIHFFVANSGAVMIPEEAGKRLTIVNNIGRNVKPLYDPGSSGRYVFQVNCDRALIDGNFADKCYAFFGTNYDVLAFTGDGTTRTFSGTLAAGHYLTPDCFKIKQGATVIADDCDHGWVRGDVTAGEMLPTRQKICDAAGVEIGWIDYRTRVWSITLATAPANGLQHRATYFVNTNPPSNIEAYYAKGNAPQITNNIATECQGDQGVFACKGDGTGGYQFNSRYQRGASVQYGAIVTGNIISNRIAFGVFSHSSAFWNQSDVATYEHNLVEGMANFILVQRGAGVSRQVSFDDSNKIRHFFGQASINIAAGSTDGMRISLDIDGLYYAGSDPVWLIKARAINGGSHRNLVVERVTMSERGTAGLRVVICSIESDATGDFDCVIERVRSRLPWRAYLKLGAGTQGRLRALMYRPTNVLTTSTIAGSAVSADYMFERESSAGAISNVLAWSEDAPGGNGMGTLYAEDLGGANQIIVTVTSVQIPTLEPGLAVLVKVAEANSHEVVMTLNGLGPNPVHADGQDLTINTLQGGQIYQMVFDGAVWQVLGLPEIVQQSLVANGGYLIHRNGMKETWGKVFMTGNSVAQFDLPIAHASWLRPKVHPRTATNPSSVLFIETGVILDPVTGNPTGVRLFNGNAYSIEVEVDTRGH